MIQTEPLDRFAKHLPKGWRAVAFRDLLREPVKNGVYKAKEFHGSGAKVVNMGELFAFDFINGQEMKRVQLDDREASKYLLQAGDLLFARRSLVLEGSGKCSLVIDAQEPTAFESSIIRARPDPLEADSRFLLYLFQSPLGRAIIAAISTRTAVSGIRASDLADVGLPVPPLDEQRRIAGILSAYDDLIENCQRRIRILEEMARRLYREWFVHFRYPGHESIPLVPSALGSIPQSWDVKKLGGLIAANIGGGWGKDAAEPGYEEPAWVIRGTDIPAARSNAVAKVPFRFHSASNLRSRRLEGGDIIFEVSGGSKGQPVGRSLLVTPQLLSAFGSDDVICASFCKRVTPVQNVSPEWLWVSFLEGYENGEIEQFQVQSTGISNFKWTEYLVQTQRAVPPTETRERFTAIVQPLVAEVGVLGLQSANLRRTRDLLLPRLMQQ